MDNIEEKIKEFRDYAVALQDFISVTQNKNLIDLCDTRLWHMIDIFLDIVEESGLSKEKHENMRNIGSKFNIWQ